MDVRWLTVCCAILVSLSGIGRAAEPLELPPASRQTIDFGRDILPLLSARCFECHAAETQESELRLDQRAGLLKGGESSDPAIVPGNSSESLLVRVVSGADPDRVMPPDGDRLSPRQIGLLRAWIDQGAVWPAEAVATGGPTTDFWSFRPLSQSTPPPIDSRWAENGIDAFVSRGLTKAGLSPSPPADGRTLIRRLYLDMLGLPPTPKEIADFVEAKPSGAYRRLVERVLASPHYGERWARHWLDVVRFAETSGFETNTDRPDAYHYRDYVIGALNSDKPYDRFVVEQLAGDLSGVDAATGFLVGGPYDRVKSPDVALTLMQRQDELADMINTTGTVFLGLTLGCAKCHNHKFDPVSQKDYYALQAIFAGVKHGSRPLRDAHEQGRLRQLAETQQRIKTLTAEFETFGVRPSVNVRRNVEEFAPVTARFVRFTISATNSGTEPCIDELEVYTAAKESEPTVNVALASAGAAATASGTLPGFAIHKLEHVNDGHHHNTHSWISDEKGRGWICIELAEPSRIGRIVWGRDRKNKFQDRLPIDYAIEVSTDRTAWQTIAGSGNRLPYHLEGPDPILVGGAELAQETARRAKQLLDELGALRNRSETLSESGRTVYAGQFEQPGPTHRLYRGDPLAPREPVVPDGLAMLGTLGLENGAPEQQRRAALADSIAGPDNPLTARVVVNRLWHYHFGTGIVETPSDFGRNGGRPTHPDLLDWLALELIRSGWSLKHLHRLILLSNTYRQSSAPDERGLNTDAQTRLLWRFPPRRLEAEVMRDSLLAVSGALEPSMGGPGFSVFEPNDNYVRVYTPKEAFGRNEWRRMVYMTKVRMEHDPIFGAFDAPDAGQVCPRRSRSTTSVQALNLFNSRFTLEQSQRTAERVRREAGSRPDEQATRAFQLAFGREPDRVEIEAAVKLIETHGLPALCRALFNASEFLFIP